MMDIKCYEDLPYTVAYRYRNNETSEYSFITAAAFYSFDDAVAWAEKKNSNIPATNTEEFVVFGSRNMNGGPKE